MSNNTENTNKQGYNNHSDYSQKGSNVPQQPTIPKMPAPTKQLSSTKYSREKDVEEKLIIPLLCKLGYGEDEYKQQMYVEIGNHNSTLIPDFVLLPDERRGSASGFAIIEAKRSIPNEKKLEEVMVQAKSYAKLLTAKYCVVAAQESIWVTERLDNYETIIFKATWEQLNDTDIFYDLNKMLGK